MARFLSALFASSLLLAPLAGCGAKIASPDARLQAGRDAQSDQSTNLGKIDSLAAGGDHSRASAVEADTISGQNVINFVVQTVEKSSLGIAAALLIVLAVVLALFVLLVMLWRSRRRISRHLRAVIRAVELSGVDVKRRVALEDAKTSKLHRMVQRETSSRPKSRNFGVHRLFSRFRASHRSQGGRSDENGHAA